MLLTGCQSVFEGDSKVYEGSNETTWQSFSTIKCIIDVHCLDVRAIK